MKITRDYYKMVRSKCEDVISLDNVDITSVEKILFSCCQGLQNRSDF